jgi:hypothetical protein
VEGVTRKLLDGLIGAADFFEKLPTHTVQSPFKGLGRIRINERT